MSDGITTTFEGLGRTVTLDDGQWRRVVDRLTGEVLQEGGRRLVTGGDPDDGYPTPPGRLWVDELTGEVLDFLPAPDVEAIAAALIEAHPALFDHLPRFRVAYRWKRAGGAEGPKARFGQCQKASGLVKHYGRVDFTIWLAADHVGDAALTRWQVEALIAHEMLHIERGTGAKSVIRPHDHEGFVDELRLYGPWQADLAQFVAAARQLPLFDEGDGDG